MVSTGILVGSTAVALVAHGHCPGAVIRGPKSEEAPPAHGPVVVGVDGSPASESALAMAFDEASLRAADLVAVHTPPTHNCWWSAAGDTAGCPGCCWARPARR